MTKTTTDNINYLLHALPGVQLETESLKSSAKSLARHTKDAILARDILVSSGWIALVPIATKVRAYALFNLDGLDNFAVTLDIPWDRQTEARHKYGGCFPGNTERNVQIKDGDCHNEPLVFRIHKFKHEGNLIIIRFYRETFSGDIVDGCKVKTSYRPSGLNYDYNFRTRNSYLSITCPIIPGKKS